MADNVPLGMEFMRWQNLPSVADMLANPDRLSLGKILGIALAGGGDNKTPSAGVAPPSGQGLSLPNVPGGIGLDAQKPSGLGIAPPATGMPTQNFVSSSPMGFSAPSSPAAPIPAGQDLDGDGVVDNFWKLPR